MKTLLGITTLLISTLAFTESDSSKLPFDDSGVYVVIDGTERELTAGKKVNTLHLGKEPFKLRFFNKRYNPDEKKFYAAKISVSTNPELLEMIKPKMNEEKVPYFAPGTGMATDQTSGYPYLFLDDGACHYVNYTNEENKRAELISENQDWLKLEMNVKGIIKKVGGKSSDIDMENIEDITLYLVTFIDRNLDDIIQKDELTKSIMHFK